MIQTKLWQGIKTSGKGLLIALTLTIIGVSVALDYLVNPNDGITLPLLVSILGSAGVGVIIIPILQRLKAGQFIREDGPQTHLKKAGTPTMGGVIFLPVALIVPILWSQFDLNVIAVSLVTLSYGLIGLVDDWQILVKKSNKGISPSVKLGLQILASIGFCVWLGLTSPPTITNVPLPFGIVLPLGILYWGLAIFVFTAESNATNLTDGVDGLAAGTCSIAFLGLSAILLTSHPELALFCACFSGACVGFVVHNRNPAKVFMGDTGSLALGGGLAAIGISTQQLFPLLILSGIFFAESLSVIAQVGYYKATKDEKGVGKRLFRMAPLHHHLELSGWSEIKIVGVFYSIACGLAIITFFSL
ncbi:phospho-N-acetylmuramoyl-pentapeptide-transferase [Dactylococcopsis salina]|uniref:Phospho-N-acetylmuramoyl-pentapeptide-transferase n=1 Tax=Dactylococcopsis salina (strain PCC 8305) TaxID=13035 RepID=K9YX65_DACS8|nr:phospho-N-acetylmuramoyl-pentapeptide-transferase [Dactylococcopsis salina]AFZ50920.1 phospho-N-acetylmuramoyl-pentapeptide-transferase [Dactylococcopsis salina PCC 8305]